MVIYSTQIPNRILSFMSYVKRTDSVRRGSHIFIYLTYQVLMSSKEQISHLVIILGLMLILNANNKK